MTDGSVQDYDADLIAQEAHFDDGEITHQDTA